MAAPYSGRTIDYLGSGLLAARPAAPNLFPGTVGFYYCTDVGSEKLTAWDGSVWADIAGGGGTGDVVGPASSVDGNLAVFDGVTGKLLKDGGAPNTYTGTAGSITLTGSAFSIDAAYVGQTSITTLGTIATGTWNATAIDATKGGTGQTGYAVGDLLYASSTTALSKLAVGTDGYVLTLASGVPTWAAASGGGGGLTGFTASLETASPNNTVNASVMLPSGGTANQDGVYAAKGIGAVQAQKADGTATGGNKRGSRAVDWQGQRAAATQVASGSNSSIGGGSNNTASGANSGVPFGANCVADATYSCAYGYGAQTKGRIAYDVHSAGAIFGGGIEGEAQQGRMVLIAGTTNATQTTLTSNGGAAAATNQVSMTLRSRACVVKGTIQAFQKTTDDVSAWEFTAFIKRPFSGSAAMVAACTPALIAQSAGATAWAVAVDADTTNNALRVRVTGEASKTIRWVCSIYDVNEIGFF